MSRVEVKICGIRTLEEAEAALAAGADALGFNFWPGSSRYVTPEEAKKIIEKTSRGFAVGVFVNEEKRRILDIASAAGLNAVQLHGDESPEFCSALGPVKTIKALRVDNGFDFEWMKKYTVNAILLDTAIKGSYGGTGKSFDWNIAREAKRFAPIILAGGLSIENVARAILEVRPAAVDVCSGVESAPGRKDLDKLRKLLNEVARANALIEADDNRAGSAGDFVSVF